MQEDSSSVDSGQRLSALALGTERNPFVAFLLTFCTAGIYGLVQVYSLFEEARRYALVKNAPVAVTSGGAAVGFLFIPVFNVIWAIMLTFKIPGLITKLDEAAGKTNGTQWGWLGLVGLLPVVGGLTVLWITQTKVNQFWRDQRLLLARSATSAQDRAAHVRAA